MPPEISEQTLAALWWRGLTPGERELWATEADLTGVTDEAGMMLACWKLYWSRGPQLSGDDIDQLSAGNCPVCRRRGFVIGPMGGMNLNVECAAVDCRSRFNVAFFGGTAVMAHHLGTGPTGPAWPSEPEWCTP